MKLVPAASSLSFAVRTAAALCFALIALCFVPSRAAAVESFVAIGSATTSITSLIFNDDGTISIEADQVGFLSGFGSFTGHFSYRAYPSANSILLLGTGNLTNAAGDKISVNATLLEVGADYPLTINGKLTITSGTGRFSEARGTLFVSGKDEASLTDQIFFRGVIVIPGPLLPPIDPVL